MATSKEDQVGKYFQYFYLFYSYGDHDFFKLLQMELDHHNVKQITQKDIPALISKYL